MSELEGLPARGVVFWPVGTGDSTTVVVDDLVVMQVDIHDMAKADDEETPEVAVVDRLVEALPAVGGKPYLATFVLTHADKDHCLGFADLLQQVTIGELWATPRLWREYNDPDAPELCSDAVAFREESERRIEATMKAVSAGGVPASGDRIRVVGYDDEQSSHAYNELPDEYLAWPGQSLTMLDGNDCAGVFAAFIHAPFRDDAAAARNETSLSMQVTLTDETGVDGKVLLFGDLAHDTIMKVFDYSEYYNREQYLAWDLLLAPHHCSKRVMYKRDADGKEQLQLDVLNAFERNARPGGTVVCSSAVFPDVDVDGHNPPHKMAADRYAEIVDEVICTMSWVDEGAPSPVVFGVDAAGARIIRGDLVKSAASEAAAELAASAVGRRFAAVTAAAVAVANNIPRSAAATTGAAGPERVDAAVNSDRGGRHAPETPVGFGH
jgi:beta-lactamase superfamily II metal-dependent hydrolase